MKKPEIRLRWNGSNRAQQEYEQAVAAFDEAHPKPKTIECRNIRVGKGQRRKNLTYQEYLRTGRWRKIRGRKLKHSGGQCETCKSTELLDVHHLNYFRLGHERMNDLQVLCRQCHIVTHENNAVSAKRTGRITCVDDLSREFRQMFR